MNTSQWRIEVEGWSAKFVRSGVSTTMRGPMSRGRVPHWGGYLTPDLTNSGSWGGIGGGTLVTHGLFDVVLWRGIDSLLWGILVDAPEVQRVVLGNLAASPMTMPRLGVGRISLAMSSLSASKNHYRFSATRRLARKGGASIASYSSSVSEGLSRAYAIALPFPRWEERCSPPLPLWEDICKEEANSLRIRRTGKITHSKYLKKRNNDQDSFNWNSKIQSFPKICVNPKSGQNWDGRSHSKRGLGFSKKIQVFLRFV